MKSFTVRTPEIPLTKTKGEGGSPSRKIAWRTTLHDAIIKEKHRTRYKKIPIGKAVGVNFVIYLTPTLMRSMDVDNIAKGVLDALQGRLAGTKTKRRPTGHRPKALLANDSQVHRLRVEKRTKRGKSALGLLTVTPFPE
jgi:Holliday junction resolvase RusA-like endonuclease